MNKITVLTPTYNRSSEIKKLFESLCLQTNKNFEWLIIDDGSKDNTEEEVLNWINKSDFRIRYKKKENGGKHTALNLGVQNIETAWTFIVDSDDILTSDAIEVFYQKVSEAEKDQTICGISFLRKNEKGDILTSKAVPRDGMVENFCDCRYKRNIMGDMAEIWKTKCLREYPFPVFDGEKFLSEDVVWIKMAQKYNMIFYNQAIYVCDYLQGGLTNNRRAINLKSPKGCMYRGKLQLESNLPLKFKVRAMMYYLVYGLTANYAVEDLWNESPNKPLFLICYPGAYCLHKKWVRK